MQNRDVRWSVWPVLGATVVLILSAMVLALVAVVQLALIFNTAEPWPTAWANAWYYGVSWPGFVSRAELLVWIVAAWLVFCRTMGLRRAVLPTMTVCMVVAGLEPWRRPMHSWHPWSAEYHGAWPMMVYMLSAFLFLYVLTQLGSGIPTRHRRLPSRGV